MRCANEKMDPTVLGFLKDALGLGQGTSLADLSSALKQSVCSANASRCSVLDCIPRAAGGLLIHGVCGSDEGATQCLNTEVCSDSQYASADCQVCCTNAGS